MTDAPIKVLVVDDDPDLLKLLKIRLDASGYETLTAENGEAGVAKLAMIRPHVVITDFTFPNLKIEESLLESAGFSLVGGQCKTPETLIPLVKDAPVTPELEQEIAEWQSLAATSWDAFEYRD